MDSRADFDAICSCTIMYEYLTITLGKEVYVTFDDVLPNSIKNLTAAYANIDFLKENVCPATDIDFSKYDLQIFLDSGNLDHICKDKKFASKTNIKKLNIDHHAGNPLYGDLNYVKHFASCCTVLFYLFKEARIEIPKDLLNVYYLGVLLDSAFFQNDTVTSEDFYMAAELKKLGAKCYEITWKLTFNENLNDARFKGLVYTNLLFLPKLKTAYTTITLAELKERKVDYKQVTFRATDLIKRLDGTDFVFVIREDEIDKENFNVSFRSHTQDFDVLKLAKHFGGGGHKMAAGATVKAKNVQDAVDTVLDFIKKQ